MNDGLLIFGIGNSGRCDDGLGWAFLDRIQSEAGFSGAVEYRYQLQVEDSAQASLAQRIIFVDSHNGALPGGFAFKPCAPSREFEFTSHVLPPRAIMHFCQELYGKTPRADLLMIQGMSWDLGVGLSPEAAKYLEDALGFFRNEVLPGLC